MAQFGDRLNMAAVADLVESEQLVGDLGGELDSPDLPLEANEVDIWDQHQLVPIFDDEERDIENDER